MDSLWGCSHEPAFLRFVLFAFFLASMFRSARADCRTLRRRGFDLGSDHGDWENLGSETVAANEVKSSWEENVSATNRSTKVTLLLIGELDAISPHGNRDPVKSMSFALTSHSLAVTTTVSDLGGHKGFPHL